MGIPVPGSFSSGLLRELGAAREKHLNDRLEGLKQTGVIDVSRVWLTIRPARSSKDGKQSNTAMRPGPRIQCGFLSTRVRAKVFRSKRRQLMVNRSSKNPLTTSLSSLRKVGVRAPLMACGCHLPQTSGDSNSIAFWK